MIIMSPIYSGDIVFARVVCSSLLKEFEIIATNGNQIGTTCIAHLSAMVIVWAKVDLRYIVFSSFDYDKGYIRDIQSGGYLFVTLEQFFFISKDSLLNEDYFCKFYAYKYSPVNYIIW